jgi:hypothetical protein
MDTRTALPQEGFLLSGAALEGVGRKLGLVGGDSNSIRLGLALGGLLWLVLLVLTWIDGVADSVFSLSAIGAHVRLLVAVPLFFVAETLLAPRMAAFVDTLVRSGVVRPPAVPALNAEVELTRRLAHSWLGEVACLLGALAMLLAGSHLHLYGRTATVSAQSIPIWTTLAGGWYGIVCLTVVRFLLLRWLWRIVLWCRFLWRLSRLDLHLVPTHPDRQAGLGYLQTVQAQFLPLVVALSAIQSAGLAEEIAAGTTSFEAVAPAAMLLLAFVAVLFLGPLLILGPRLRSARLWALERYMELGSGYVTAFEVKWIERASNPAEAFLGSADIQSLADLQGSFSSVDDMRWIPVSVRLALLTAAATLAPLAPLILFKYPIAELSEKLMGHLIGS